MSEKRSESTRRQFLKGKSAVDAIGNLGDRIHQELPATEAAGEGTSRTYLVQVSRRAMACEFAVYLNAGKHDAATEHAVEALDLVENIEDQISVYRNRSEVSQLNFVAAKRPVKVNARLFSLLQMARLLYDETDGAFDVTAGPLIKVWGFYRREGKLPSNEALQEALACVGNAHVKLVDATSTIEFNREGVEVNFGGIGKGFALDQCKSLLRSCGVSDFMIHGGNSSVLASGRRAGASEGQGWKVGIRHPSRPERRIAEINLQDRSIGTSGTGTQHFYHQGKKYGHIIDPRSGQPVDGILSATVVATSAAMADALSTAFYVMGIESTRKYCETHPDVGALIIRTGSKAGVVEIEAIGIADNGWSRVDE